MEIINFDKSYFDELVTFFSNEFPEIQNAREYLNYNLFIFPIHQDSYKKNLLVIDNGCIIGLQMYFHTYVSINGDIKETLWGHHTIITQKYRKTEAGLMLMLYTSKISAFGCGLTLINKKILTVLKKNFIGKSCLFLHFNFYSYKLFLYKIGIGLSAHKSHYNLPLKVEIFNYIKDVKNFVAYNDGFWNKNQINTDFIRNTQFINNRFFLHYNQYFLYQAPKEYDYSYFVVRFVVYKNVRALALIDYRFPLNRLDIWSEILCAVKKISRKNGIPVVLTRCSYENLYPSLRKELFIHVGIGGDIVSGDVNSSSVLITLADSDGENGLD